MDEPEQMKIMTLNANGIRAAHRKGFFEWMLKQDVDVVCIQETKAQTHQLVEDILSPNGYFGFFNDAVMDFDGSLTGFHGPFRHGIDG